MEEENSETACTAKVAKTDNKESIVPSKVHVSGTTLSLEGTS